MRFSGAGNLDLETAMWISHFDLTVIEVSILSEALVALKIGSALGD